MRRILFFTVLAFALPGAGTAQAAWESGFYAGATSQWLPRSHTRAYFSLGQTGLGNFRITVRFRCTDSDNFTTTISGFPRQNVVGRTLRGAFRGVYNASFVGSRGASRYTHRGSVLNRTATGTFTGRRVYNDNDQLDRNGDVVCTTGTVTYVARKQVRS